jgi:coenzyme Q-binding protein COQ10
MGTRLHTHVLPQRPDQLYELVADVEKYPEFLPWCLAVRVLSRSEVEIVAELTVGYKFFRETFLSRVHLTPKSRIDVEYVKGPFRHLNNHWIFKEGPNQGTAIDFFIDFQFHNGLLQSATKVVFDKTFDSMLNAFERRAQQVYGV